MDNKLLNYYKSENYLFQIVANLNFKIFEIFSKHINSETYSCITNLNYLISQFEENFSENDLYYDSTWLINSVESLKLINQKATGLLTDNIFIKYLEQGLDKDREIGGWNSDYRFNIA